MGAKKDKTREQAKAYFIDNIDCTYKEVAELYSITEKTISKWATEDDWQETRINFHASPIKIKQLLQQELLTVASGGAAKINADSISKLMSALDKCDRKADPIIVARILKDLDNYICDIDAAFAAKCTEYHKKFLQHRIQLEQ